MLVLLLFDTVPCGLWGGVQSLYDCVLIVFAIPFRIERDVSMQWRGRDRESKKFFTVQQVADISGNIFRHRLSLSSRACARAKKKKEKAKWSACHRALSCKTHKWHLSHEHLMIMSDDI